MAPSISGYKNDIRGELNDFEKVLKIEKKKLIQVRKFIEKNFDYVGKNFAYEARSIHYNNKKRNKGIYGKASKKDLKELKEEGINTQILPWVENENN